MGESGIQRLESTHDVRRRGPIRVAVRRDWAPALPMDEMLAGAPLRAWGTPLAHELQGRAAIEVLETPAGQIVAKTLTRGGLLGGWLPDLFVDGQRPWREALLAEDLAGLGCPTPPVVAVRSTASALGLSRLELATARVDGARDLLDALFADEDPRPLVRLTGQALRKLHDGGLRHRDLQVKNLLIPRDPEDGVVVIDLDRCALGAALDDEERVASLTRFARSLVKRGVAGGPWGPLDCRAFLEAYGRTGDGTRAGLLARVRKQLARQLRWHRWAW
jgi:tRNA A-37 threonylcarbamoyl transferase component Bud32